MKLVMPIKMSDWILQQNLVGKNLSDMFPVRNGLKVGDVLSPLLFSFALDYAIRGVHVIQDDLK